MAEKQRHALELRLAGWSIQDIADLYGVDKSNASRWCSAAIRDIPKEAAEEYRQRQLLQLDILIKGIWNDASAGNDFKIDRILAIMERQAKLMGLDQLAAMQAARDMKGLPAVDAWIEALTNGGNPPEGFGED